MAPSNRTMHCADREAGIRRSERERRILNRPTVTIASSPTRTLPNDYEPVEVEAPKDLQICQPGAGLSRSPVYPQFCAPSILAPTRQSESSLCQVVHFGAVLGRVEVARVGETSGRV
jgi:hypothetical protein